MLFFLESWDVRFTILNLYKPELGRSQDFMLKYWKLINEYDIKIMNFFLYFSYVTGKFFNISKSLLWQNLKTNLSWFIPAVFEV
jgi:hypothetical protein